MDTPEYIMSPLPKTWIFDIDGTLLIHNGYLSGEDIPIDSSLNFIRKLPTEDHIILLTSRSEKYRTCTEEYLKKIGIRFDAIIFGLPTGERILINDSKPSGLKTAYAICVERDKGINAIITIDSTL